MAYRCVVAVEYSAEMDDNRRAILLAQAKAVADAHQWPLCIERQAHVVSPAEFDVCLILDAQGWSAKWLSAPEWKPLYFDYAHPAFLRRLKQVGPRSETLIKALGRRKPEHVLDCTGGAGEETLLLSAYGARVTMIERDPVLAILLEDALARARAIGDVVLKDIVDRVTFIRGDAITILKARRLNASLVQASEDFDVVYCDPMFPARDKSALVSKTMQFFHYLLGPAPDASPLVAAACAVARRRVIVKRPAKAPCVLADSKPNQHIQNKAVRFDIYLTGSAESV